MGNLLSTPFLSVPPTIKVDLRSEDGRRVIECVAADAVPAANVSWRLPDDVSVDFWLNSTTYNESHSVRRVILLPACLPWELTAECVINHPAFQEPENRSITLPFCGMYYKSANGSFWFQKKNNTFFRLAIIYVHHRFDLLLK